MKMRTALGALAAVMFLLGSAFAQQSTLTIARPDDIRAMNPIRQANNATSQVTYQVHEGLVTMNPEQELQPVLATDWELLEDDVTWRISLREGVTFHSGEPFTAEDVKWNFERQLDPDDPGIAAGLIPPVAEIEIIDDHTLDVTLEEPNGVFMNVLGAPLFMIVDPTRYQEVGDENYGNNPSGTGAFEFAEWTPDQRVILEANEDYWGEPGAEVDRVVFEVMPEQSSRIIALRNGEVDIAFAVPAEEMESFDENPDFNAMRTPTMRVMWIGVNTAHPRLPTPVRRAMAHAIDKETMMNVVGDNGVLATGIGMPSAFGFFESDWAYDPEAAREILHTNGWTAGDDGVMTKDGMRLEFDILARGSYPGEIEGLQVVQLQLREVGIALNIERVESGAWFAALDEGASGADENGGYPDYELWTAASGIRTGEVGYITERPKCDQGGRNWERYCNPDYDEAFETSQAPLPEEERLEGYRTMAELFHNDALRIPLFVIQNNTVTSDDVEGFVVNPNDSLNLKGVSVSSSD
ncbi:MAG: ABC transporter substrate-binding protein [Trueperaceae bacterium]|nr:ABC transporter substrate-binding protein [Trueperaceae bacterium]